MDRRDQQEEVIWGCGFDEEPLLFEWECQQRTPYHMDHNAPYNPNRRSNYDNDWGYSHQQNYNTKDSGSRRDENQAAINEIREMLATIIATQVADKAEINLRIHEVENKLNIKIDDFWDDLDGTIAKLKTIEDNIVARASACDPHDKGILRNDTIDHCQYINGEETLKRKQLTTVGRTSVLSSSSTLRTRL